MLAQIIIAGIILTVGGILFSSEIHGLFPQEIESATSSIKTDVVGLSSKTVDSIEKGLDESSNIIEEKIDSPLNIIKTSKDSLTEKISNITP